jgi:hypothetical protein
VADTYRAFGLESNRLAVGTSGAGRVDVQVNRLCAVLVLEEEQLGNDELGNGGNLPKERKTDRVSASAWTGES